MSTDVTKLPSFFIFKKGDSLAKLQKSSALGHFD